MRWLLSLSFALLSVVILGCGEPTGTVTGTVTYEGQPINGYITFNPADGQGPTAAAEVTGGAFTMAKVVPGKKSAQIIGAKPIKFNRTGAQLSDADRAKLRAGAAGAAEKADEIPPDAVGNNVPVVVEAGAQTLEFKLRAPAK